MPKLVGKKSVTAVTVALAVVCLAAAYYFWLRRAEHFVLTTQLSYPKPNPTTSQQKSNMILRTLDVTGKKVGYIDMSLGRAYISPNFLLRPLGMGSQSYDLASIIVPAGMPYWWKLYANNPPVESIPWPADNQFQVSKTDVVVPVPAGSSKNQYLVYAFAMKPKPPGFGR